MDRVSRAEVRQQFELLIAGRITRAEASAWAVERQDLTVEDQPTGRAIGDLVIADAHDGTSWLYHETDFTAWLAELDG